MPDIDAPIEVLQLSPRPYNVLTRAGFRTVGQVVVAPNDDLLDLRNFGGLRHLEELRARIAPYLAGQDQSAWAPDPDR